MNLREILALEIDDRFKGIPGGTAAFPLGRVRERRWNLLAGHLPLPSVLLKESAIQHNSRWMQRFIRATGVRLAPHGKTTMSPQLFQRQLADGAWGITLATVGQLQVARRFGVARVFLANELVGPAEIGYVVAELKRDPDFDFYCLVDSVDVVRRLVTEQRRLEPGRPLQVLVEHGIPGARAGCRTPDEALAVARAVKREEPWLALRGVEGFEGVIGAAGDAGAEERARAFLASMVETARRSAAEGLFADGPVILTAGGSTFFDLVVDEFGRADLGRETLVLLRSGCYLTQDARQYEEAFQRILQRSRVARDVGPGLVNAIELWSHVLSRPEPTRAILGFGKRDTGHDAGLPRPLAWFRAGQHDHPMPLGSEHVVVTLNDQHAFLDLPPASPLQVGDMVSVGVSHPCTTFDKWQVLPVVDDQYDVVDLIRTFF